MTLKIMPHNLEFAEALIQSEWCKFNSDKS